MSDPYDSPSAAFSPYLMLPARRHRYSPGLLVPTQRRPVATALHPCAILLARFLAAFVINANLPGLDASQRGHGSNAVGPTSLESKSCCQTTANSTAIAHMMGNMADMLSANDEAFKAQIGALAAQVNASRTAGLP